VRAATATSSERLQAGTFATRQRERGKRSVMPSPLRCAVTPVPVARQRRRVEPPGALLGVPLGRLTSSGVALAIAGSTLDGFRLGR
jgi:hypothetical protein